MAPARNANPGALAEDSIVRRRASDPRAGVGAAGYALALQVSHPVIAGGVRDHSDYDTDPWGRFFRTSDFVLQLAYGDEATVRRLGTGLREQHAAIRGTDPDGRRYSALEPSAYAWVHATLGLSIVHAHDRMGTTFTGRERERFWQEWLVLGDHLHVSRARLPGCWADVDAYLQSMIDDVLEDNDQVQAVKARSAAVDGSPPVRWIPRRAWEPAGRALAPVLGFLGTGMLPGELRDRFALRWTRHDRRRFDAYCRVSKASGRVLSQRMKEAAPVAAWVRRNEVGPFGIPNRGARLAG